MCSIIYCICFFAEDTGVRKSTSDFTSYMSSTTCHAISAIIAGNDLIVKLFALVVIAHVEVNVIFLFQ